MLEANELLFSGSGGTPQGTGMPEEKEGRAQVPEMFPLSLNMYVFMH